MDDRVNLWGGLPDRSRPHPMAKKPWAKSRGPDEPRRPWNPIPMDGQAKVGSHLRGPRHRASPRRGRACSPTLPGARRIRVVTLVVLLAMAAVVAMRHDASLPRPAPAASTRP